MQYVPDICICYACVHLCNAEFLSLQILLQNEHLQYSSGCQTAYVLIVFLSVIPLFTYSAPVTNCSLCIQWRFRGALFMCATLSVIGLS